MDAAASTGLIWDTPGWLLLLGAIGALTLALLLYGWTRTPGLSRAGRIFLTILRTATALTLIALLLGPLLRQRTEQIEAPEALVLLDASASVGVDLDSAGTESLERFAMDLARQLSDQTLPASLLPFSHTLASSAPTRVTFEGTRTDLGAALEELAYRSDGRNLAGVVLLTDGRTNRGVNPEFGARLPQAPLLTIGLGDTLRRPDRAVERVDVNRLAYLGNQFPVEALVSLHGETATAGQARVRLILDGQTLDTQEIRWSTASPSLIKRLRFLVPADAVGLRRGAIEIETSAAEKIRTNNRQSFTVEVLEKRKSVLVLAAVPHPDLGAFASALASDEGYTVNIRYASLSPASGDYGRIGDLMESADVIVAHDLSHGGSRGNDWQVEASESGKPVLNWWSRVPAAGAPVLAGVNWTPNDLHHDIRPGAIENFELFEIPEALFAGTADLPPLRCPMGELTLSAAWRLALTRQLGTLNTAEPLAAFRVANGGAGVGTESQTKSGLLIGSGWWRFRTASIARSVRDGDTPPPLDAFFRHAIQYLTSDTDIRPFRVTAPERIEEDREAFFKAEVYDGALNPLPGIDISLRLVEAQNPNSALEFTFAESTGDEADVQYAVNCGRLPAGNYRWEAFATVDGNRLIASGELDVDAVQAEWSSEPADHGLLVRLSDRTGGMHLGAWSAGERSEQLTAEVVKWFSDNRPPDYVFEEIELSEIIDWEWIAVLVLVLLTTEWVIRRRTLGY